MAAGSLVVVGTGIQIGQTTIEAKAQMEVAGKLFYLVADPATAYWITKLNPTAESLYGFYSPEKKRLQTYFEMVQHIMESVRQGLNVCAAFYGHPGVFVFPSHEVIQQAQQEGFAARMLPGVSAEDCLFADLGIDPGTGGCQSFEATEFLVHPRRFDPTVGLILWQISVVGEFGYRPDREATLPGLRVLVEELIRFYGDEHEVVIYEASTVSICKPFIRCVKLSTVPGMEISPVATMFVPPKDRLEYDVEMTGRLGFELGREQDEQLQMRLRISEPAGSSESSKVLDPVSSHSPESS
jgi:Tetrapyrrole (Corrin/Porphyrin) Methylases